MGRKENTTTGITALDALFLVLLALKLCGAITWSWWWIFAPIWIPCALIAIILIILYLNK